MKFSILALVLACPAAALGMGNQRFDDSLLEKSVGSYALVGESCGRDLLGRPVVSATLSYDKAPKTLHVNREPYGTDGQISLLVFANINESPQSASEDVGRTIEYRARMDGNLVVSESRSCSGIIFPVCGSWEAQGKLELHENRILLTRGLSGPSCEFVR
jgi:hypothetical protein